MTGEVTSQQGPGRLLWLDVLRCVAVCGVVAIHSFGLVVSNDDLRGSAQWAIACVLDLGMIWTVPVFVMISGAFTLHPRAHAAGPGSFYRKRAAKIVPAIVFWHLFYVVVIRMALRGEQVTLRNMVTMFGDAKVFTALYFLWLIAGLYMVAPVLESFLSRGDASRARIAALTASAWVVLTWTTPNVMAALGKPRPLSLNPWNYFVPYIGYYLLGWWLRAASPTRGRAFASLLGAAALLALGSWEYIVAPEHPWLRAFVPPNTLGIGTMLASVLLYVGFQAIRGSRFMLIPGRVWSSLSEATFGVFLVHLAILELFRKWLPQGVGDGSSLGLVAAAFAGTLVASFAISLTARRVPYLNRVF